MINATVKLRVCLTEMCAMENSKGKGERRECPGQGGGGGWQESRVVRFRKEESGRSLRKYP